MTRSVRFIWFVSVVFLLAQKTLTCVSSSMLPLVKFMSISQTSIFLEELITYSYRFAECKNRNNHSALILPYSFLPSRAAKKLRNAAEKVCIMWIPWSLIFTPESCIKFLHDCSFFCVLIRASWFWDIWILFMNMLKNLALNYPHVY